MGNQPAHFKQVDVTRAVKGVVAAGKDVARIDVEPDGRIRIFTTAHASETESANDWDEVLTDD